MGTAALRIADQQAADDGLDQWVARAQVGDSAAYERVYRACVGRVHGLCLRMSGSAQQAEELGGGGATVEAETFAGRISITRTPGG